MRIQVQGNAPLRGDYYPSGNSNAAISTIAASLLTDAPLTLRNVPDTLSIQQMLSIAEQIGTQVTRHEDGYLQLHTPHIQTRILETDTVGRFAASVLFLAGILSRRHHARLEWTESLSRLYTHLTALRDLGIEIEIDGHAVSLSATPWQEREILLIESSVTATALVCMLAAVMGQKTVIYNAASEPHLRILQQQLIQMGTRIEGIGSNLLTVYGTSQPLKGADVSLPYDHIEIASIAAIAAMTPGQVAIHHVNLADMRMILKIFDRLGVQYYLENRPDQSSILHMPEQAPAGISRRQEDAEIAISTAPWPGFPSDLVAITTVLATRIRGTTLIHEKLFPNRLLFTDKLKAMGAQIVLCDPHRAIVIGSSSLRGEYIDTPDVRTGLGLLAAALRADNRSIIDNAHLINRTFDNVLEKLTAIGAKIRVEDYD